MEQILTGENSMNCQLCKYRTQVLGFEADVGAAQESHHHHVEGISAEQDGPFKLISLPHSHDHDHTHAPYPHANHPLGPVTLKGK